MRRVLAVLLVCLLGCGGGRFTFRSGSPVFSITGFVSFVELTTVPDSTIVVTIVTFLPDFSPVTTVSFCGDLTTQLFLGDFATVNFTQGPSCARSIAESALSCFASFSWVSRRLLSARSCLRFVKHQGALTPCSRGC